MAKGKYKRKTKVHQLEVLVDKYGRYVPWCDYEPHIGYIRTPDICQERKCKHYRELRIIYNGNRTLGEWIK